MSVCNSGSLVSGFHSLRHTDLHLNVVNSTFDQTSWNYLQSLILFAIPWAAVGVFMLLLYLIHFMCRCCHRNDTNTDFKNSVGRVICATVAMTLICFAALGAALAGSVLISNGVDGVQQSLLDAGGYVDGLLDQVNSGDSILNATLTTSAQLQPYRSSMNLTVQTAYAALNASIVGVENELGSVTSEADNLPFATYGNNIESYDTDRLIAFVCVFAALLLLVLLGFLAVLCRSYTGTFVVGIISVILLTIAWVVAGVLFSAMVAASDICCDPYAPILTALDATDAQTQALAKYYLYCSTGSVNPLNSYVQQALTQISNSQAATSVLQSWALANATTEPLVLSIINDINLLNATLIQIQQNLSCTYLNSLFVSGVSSACSTAASSAVSNIFVSLIGAAVFAGFFILLICLYISLWKHFKLEQITDAILHPTKLYQSGKYASADADPMDRLKLLTAEPSAVYVDNNPNAQDFALTYQTSMQFRTVRPQAYDS